MVGYYTTKEMADKMRASFIRMAAKSGMTIEDFIYKGSPRNNSSTATSIDYWDNTEKSSTTKKTKPIEKKSEPAKPKLDFWDDKHFTKPYDGELRNTGFFEGSRGCMHKCHYCINRAFQVFQEEAGKVRRNKSPRRRMETICDCS